MSEDAKRLDEEVGIEVISIALDTNFGTMHLDLGTVTPSTATAIFRNLIEWLDRYQPTPQITYDGHVILDMFEDFEDEEDEDEDIEGL